MMARRWLDRLTVAGFAGGLLLIGLLSMLIRSDAISRLENRALAKFPGLAELNSDWSAVPRQVNAWAEDHVIKRDVILRINRKIRRDLRLEETQQAVRGKDGWLFANLNQSLDMHTGKFSFDDDKAGRWVESAGNLRDRVEAEGAVFAILIAPNKATIHPEYLPQFPVSPTVQTPLERLETDLPKAGVLLVSPRERLETAAHAGQALYRKTDTHWSEWGAYLAYRDLMATLHKQGVKAPVLRDDALRVSDQNGFRGDIYTLLGEPDGKPEDTRRWAPAEPVRTLKTTRFPDLDFMAFEATRWTMETDNPERLLIIGDSFSYPILPFLKESFGEVTFVHHHLGEVPLEALQPESYDVVILEMVERGLSRPLIVPPKTD